MDSRLIAEPAIGPRFARDPLAIPGNDGREKILVWIQLDLGRPVPGAKIFRFPFDPNHLHISRHPGPHKGAFRDRHERKARDAMDAGGATDERANLRTAKSCGPDAPTLASSWRKAFPPATVANKPGHRGEREISR
jgi:hypothetical protein